MARKLQPDELYNCCDPSIFDFETTADIKETDGTIGQARAISAIDFGLTLQSKGFNIYILGESGTGKMSTIKAMLKERAEREPVPSDWVYVYNFKDADSPTAIPLPPGTADIFQKDMDELVKILKLEIPKVFESKEYDKQKNKLMEEFQKSQKGLFGSLEEDAQAKGFSIRKTVGGLLVVPVKKTGDPLSEDEFEALDETSKKKIEELGKALQERLDDVVRAVREDEKAVKESMSKLEREAALSAVGHLIDELKAKYKDYEKIVLYLDAVREDILSHLEDFKGGEEQAPPMPFMKMPKTEPTFTRYAVNIVVNNKDTKGAPCIFESNPTYFNLFGRIEYKVQYGLAITDFSMIKGGSMHRANGGYIIIDALDMLRAAFSYEAIKRALRNQELKIEDVLEQYRLMSTSTIKPEAIPLDVKIVLIGNPHIYYLLYNADEEYKELFKVKADFDGRMERNNETITKYAGFIASKTKAEKLLPFDKSGVSKIVEYGSRLADDQNKLSARFSDVADILRESHYWAVKGDSKVVKEEHVEKALNQKIYRSNRIEERILEVTLDDTMIVRTSGTAVGQVNGLAVLSMGDYSFGKPSRITAKTYTGKAGVINIERETKMSGKIHEKAILILSHFLGSAFAVKKPISLTASITFEQLYDMIEGDSATCAELYALLSSIAGVPLKQNIALTGSMDQNGDVQPIGGVNQKVEGFFDLCKARGLDGSHGVIIPVRNIRNLMLKKEVVDAIKDGKFTIYPIKRVEEGIEILTDMPAGIMQDNGAYPEGTVNYLVAKRLGEIDKAMKPKKDKKDKEAETENENGEKSE